MTELKPCPFCGNTENDGLGIRYATGNVYCQCGVSKPVHGWNSRPLENAQAAEIAMMKSNQNSLAIMLKEQRAEIEQLNAALDAVIAYKVRPDGLTAGQHICQILAIARAARNPHPTQE